MLGTVGQFRLGMVVAAPVFAAQGGIAPDAAAGEVGCRRLRIDDQGQAGIEIGAAEIVIFVIEEEAFVEKAMRGGHGHADEHRGPRKEAHAGRAFGGWACGLPEVAHPAVVQVHAAFGIHDAGADDRRFGKHVGGGDKSGEGGIGHHAVGVQEKGEIGKDQIERAVVGGPEAEVAGVPQDRGMGQEAVAFFCTAVVGGVVGQDHARAGGKKRRQCGEAMGAVVCHDDGRDPGKSRGLAVV